MQIELAYIYTKSGIVNSNVYGFFNSSDNAMVLPSNYMKVIMCGSVACIVTMVMYGGLPLGVL